MIKLMKSKTIKLNLGGGKKKIPGFLNVDLVKTSQTDVVHDLNIFPWPFKDNTFKRIKSMYVLELLDDFIKAVEEIWRVGRNNALIEVASPLFPNMRSAQDPLTKKFMTYNSFDYFDVENSCENDCSCTDNACQSFIVYLNDDRCTECKTNADCDNLTKDYCIGDTIVNERGICVDFECRV